MWAGSLQRARQRSRQKSSLYLHVLAKSAELGGREGDLRKAVGRISGNLSAIQVVDVPPAVHPVGAKVAAQLWIGVVDVSRAADVWREAGGIPGHGLGVGRQFRCATLLFRDV